MGSRLPAILFAAAIPLAAAVAPISARDQQSFPDSAGTVRTVTTSGAIDRRNRFFQPLGKQFPATCEHCHFESDAWGISAEHVRQLFSSTGGRHPIFTAPSANDFHAALALPANGALADRQAAFSLLLDKGLVLVRRNFDSGPADLDVVTVVDPSLPQALHTISVDGEGRIVPNGTPGSTRAIPGTAYLEYTARDNGGTPQLWIHRRPLLTTNFKFLTTVSWDGQDTRQSPNPKARSVLDAVLDVTKNTIRARETGPSLAAASGHTFTDAELMTAAQEITAFMFTTFAAQESLTDGLSLSADGAAGGAVSLSGRFAHIGQFKGPILRDMSARAPFFHNGMAATLEDVVDFYNERFNGNFTPQEKADLAAFLKAL